ncbi:hypothetical protein CALCODRAFT_112220 [Calocera cornea HHB12733]|uniref:Uncharacterized protein n=1 Tax=Calocera cornea HHB12733 TaxID=1353952 RepID=A0A165D1N4_9BASI|nr:hypothetical protein CALCODRAFT_112220 [Calocera cornea HHB12733]
MALISGACSAPSTRWPSLCPDWPFGMCKRTGRRREGGEGRGQRGQGDGLGQMPVPASCKEARARPAHRKGSRHSIGRDRSLCFGRIQRAPEGTQVGLRVVPYVVSLSSSAKQQHSPLTDRAGAETSPVPPYPALSQSAPRPHTATGDKSPIHQTLPSSFFHSPFLWLWEALREEARKPTTGWRGSARHLEETGGVCGMREEGMRTVSAGFTVFIVLCSLGRVCIRSVAGGLLRAITLSIIYSCYAERISFPVPLSDSR